MKITLIFKLILFLISLTTLIIITFVIFDTEEIKHIGASIFFSTLVILNYIGLIKEID